MIKLYKNVDGQLRYWECWEDEASKMATVHWGPVGQTGETEEISFRKLAELQSKINQARAEGYCEVDSDDHFPVLIEYAIDEFGNDSDLEKRHSLEDRMSETLGWSGLGHCDGGSSGSGTMEVCCFVVDTEIAIQTIKADLQNTEFANFTRIYVEN